MTNLSSLVAPIKNLTRKDWLTLGLYVFGFLAVSYLLGVMTRDNLYPWYQNLEKPPFTAPNWLFPVVWPLLYVVLAVVMWRIARLNDSRLRDAAWGHIFLNWAWTPVFFGLHQLGAAFFWLILMLVTLVYVVLLLRERDRTSIALLIPYAAWLAFATYMSGGVWLLNNG